jgi:DNA mismatch repair ATPase MutS
VVHPSVIATATTDPRAEYARRAAERAALAGRLAARFRALVRARNVFVGALVAVAWICEKERLFPLLLALPVILFVGTVLAKNYTARAWRQALRRLGFNQRRLRNLDGSWAGTGEPGDRYLDDAHSYARDLDLFGPGSLYERLHLDGSRRGEDTLADWLRTPAEPPEVRDRQAAVAELRDRLDLREDLAMLAQDMAGGALTGLRPFRMIRARLRGEPFRCPLLRRIVASLSAARLPGPLVAAREVMPLNPRLFPLLTFNRWQRRHGATLTEGLAALGQLEALQALAAYAFENSADPFPELLDFGPCFEADDLGHPLLPPGRCVGNDVRLNDGLRLVIVSGSNMSGKSTLLRTVGANTVLGLAGGPVRARRLRLSRLTPGATLRLQDSLREGRSRFYAEVARVRQLLDLSRDRPPLLFLLDELFSGTNSDDRRQGAEAVVRRLLDAGAVGLMTTHDLALTHLAELLGPRVANVHFADQFAAGEMTFDYRMRPGVLRNGNGVALMRALGIEV